MRFFGLKTCDSCKKALKALKAAEYAPVVIDVRADGVEKPDMDRFFKTFGSSLLNKNAKTWRELSENQKNAAPLDLLASHPTLMKRPVIEDGDRLTLGWSRDVAESWLG